MHAGRFNGASPLGEPGPSHAASGVRAYWNVVRRRKWIIALGWVATVAGAIGVISMHKAVYSSEARVLVAPLAGDYTAGSGGGQNGANEVEVLRSSIVQERVRSNLGLAPDTDVPAVSASKVGTTSVIAVQVQSGDARTARILADAYVDAFRSVKREQNVESLLESVPEFQSRIDTAQARIDAIDDQLAGLTGSAAEGDRRALQGQRDALVGEQASYRDRINQLQLNASLYSPAVRTIRPAYQPSTPIAPKPLNTLSVALVVGLMFGVAAAFLLDYLDDSVRTTEQVERLSGGLPVLAVVPAREEGDDPPISLLKPTDPAVEAYRGLRTHLQFLDLTRRSRLVQVTSALPGEGKTTVASNLAVVLAQAGNRVVLVDADLRRPRVHRMFGLDGSYGLVDALLGQPLPLLLQRIEVAGGGELAALPVGKAPSQPSEILGGARMRAVFASLAETFDVVVVDSAPVLPVADSVVLSGAVESVVVVIQAGRTSEREVAEVMATLGRVNAPVVGTVLNRFDSKQAGGYGYGYGYGYGDDGSSDSNAETNDRGRRKHRKESADVPV